MIKPFPLALLAIMIISATMASAYLLRGRQGQRAQNIHAMPRASQQLLVDAAEAAAGGETPASSPSMAVEAKTAPKAHALQLEANLRSPTGLLIQAAQRELATEADFDRLLAVLHDGYHADPDASEINRVYERQIGATFAASDTGIGLDRIACGLSVCAAKFSGGPTASMKFLDTLMGSSQQGKARIYSAKINIVPPSSGGNRVGYRVIFSTDPAMSELTGHY